MAHFAVLNDNKVINVILADTKENAEIATNYICVEFNDDNPAYIGWVYDGEKFHAPVIETPTE